VRPLVYFNVVVKSERPLLTVILGGCNLGIGCSLAGLYCGGPLALPSECQYSPSAILGPVKGFDETPSWPF
jgi:hypothetical protein